MLNYKNITRNDFMHFFRNNEKLNELSTDDRLEIFKTVLVGNSDITKKLLDEVLIDYCVTNIEIKEVVNG